MARPSDPESIGTRVLTLRKAIGLSQTQLAQQASISPSYISMIESGKRAPTDQALASLAVVLGTDVLHLAHGWDGIDAAVRLAVDYADLDVTSGDAAGAIRRLQALDLESAAPSTRARALTVLARAHEVCGDLERAIDILEGVLVDARERGDHLDTAAAAMALVTGCIESGDLIRAGEVGLAALLELERAGLTGSDEHLRLGAALVWAYTERGDLLNASSRATQLIEQAEALGSPLARGSVYWNAALLAEERRDYALAKRHTERALALIGEYESVRDLPRLRLQYAHVLLVSTPPAPDAALHQLDRARPAIVTAGSPVEVAVLDTEQARAQLIAGDPAGALELAGRAIERLGEQPRLEAAEAHLVLGDAYQALGQPNRALQSFRWAAERLGMMSASRRAAGAWRKIADRYRAAGELQLALEAFAQGMAEAGFPADPLPCAVGSLP